VLLGASRSPFRPFGAAATARATSHFNAKFFKTFFVFFLRNKGASFCEWKELVNGS
jgi:hypothetical protein